MQELKIATRQCMDPQNRPRLFHYFLTVDQEDNPHTTWESYGVRVSEEGGEAVTLRAVTTSAVRIDELLTLLVDNRVGPVGVADVVADWL